MTVQAVGADVVLLRVVGDLDIASAPELAETLDKLRARRRSVLLDLSGLAFMDSTGLRALLDARAEARRDGWQLTLLQRLTSEVTRLIELTETRALFDWQD